MTYQPVTRLVTVTNSQGLHARPADMVAKAASSFQSHVEIVKEDTKYDATSILSLLTLGAVRGTRLELRAIGVDAEEAVAAVAELFERGFNEAASADALANGKAGNVDHE